MDLIRFRTLAEANRFGSQLGSSALPKATKLRAKRRAKASRLSETRSARSSAGVTRVDPRPGSEPRPTSTQRRRSRAERKPKDARGRYRHAHDEQHGRDAAANQELAEAAVELAHVFSQG